MPGGDVFGTSRWPLVNPGLEKRTWSELPPRPGSQDNTAPGLELKALSAIIRSVAREPDGHVSFLYLLLSDK